MSELSQFFGIKQETVIFQKWIYFLMSNVDFCKKIIKYYQNYLKILIDDINFTIKHLIFVEYFLEIIYT